MNRFIFLNKIISYIIIISFIYSNCVYSCPNSHYKSTLSNTSEFICPEFRKLIKPFALIANIFDNKATDQKELSIIRYAFAGLPSMGHAKDMTVVYNRQGQQSEIFIYDRNKIIHIYKQKITTLPENPIYQEAISSINIDLHRFTPAIKDIKGTIILEAEQKEDIKPEETMRIIREHIINILRDAKISEDNINNCKTLQGLINLIPKEYIETHGNSTLIAYLNELIRIATEAEKKMGNIASGDMTEAQHEGLNTIIGQLINTENDVTAEYNQMGLKNQLKEVLKDILPSLPPEIKDRIIPLLDNPELKFFFLKPRYSEDKFSFSHREADGKETVLHAEAHFGHHKTKGSSREENCYFSSSYFDSRTTGERLGLITHELIHLIMGKGDDVHKIAEDIQRMVERRYDNMYRTTLLRLTENMKGKVLTEADFNYIVDKLTKGTDREKNAASGILGVVKLTDEQKRTQVEVKGIFSGPKSIEEAGWLVAWYLVNKGWRITLFMLIERMKGKVLTDDDDKFNFIVSKLTNGTYREKDAASGILGVVELTDEQKRTQVEVKGIFSGTKSIEEAGWLVDWHFVKKGWLSTLLMPIERFGRGMAVRLEEITTSQKPSAVTPQPLADLLQQLLTQLITFAQTGAVQPATEALAGKPAQPKKTRKLTEDEFNFIIDKLTNGTSSEKNAASGILGVVELTKKQKQTKVEIEGLFKGTKSIEEAGWLVTWHIVNEGWWTTPLMLIERMKSKVLTEDEFNFIVDKLTNGTDREKDAASGILGVVELTDEQKRTQVEVKGIFSGPKSIEEAGWLVAWHIIKKEWLSTPLLLIERMKSKVLTEDEFNFIVDKLTNGTPNEKDAASGILGVVKLTDKQKRTQVEVKGIFSGPKSIEEAGWLVAWYFVKDRGWLSTLLMLIERMEGKALTEDEFNFTVDKLTKGTDREKNAASGILGVVELTDEQKKTQVEIEGIFKGTKSIEEAGWLVTWHFVNKGWGTTPLMLIKGIKGKALTKDKFNFIKDKLTRVPYIDREKDTASGILGVVELTDEQKRTQVEIEGIFKGTKSIEEAGWLVTWYFVKNKGWWTTPLMLTERFSRGMAVRPEEITTSPKPLATLLQQIFDNSDFQKILFGIETQSDLVIPDELLRALWVLLAIRQFEYIKGELQTLENTRFSKFLEKDWFLGILAAIKDSQNKEGLQKLIQQSKTKTDAYFCEIKDEEMDPQIRRILEDPDEKDYRFIRGKTIEGKTGKLELAKEYREAAARALEIVGGDYPDLSGYGVAVLKGVNFSGHYSSKRDGRVYIPYEMFSITNNPRLLTAILVDLIEHEYLHTQIDPDAGKYYTEESIISISKQKRPGIYENARTLYRKYIAKKLVETFREIKDADSLRIKLNRILMRVQEGKRIELTETQLHGLLWLIDRSKQLNIAREIAELINLILEPNYTGNPGQVVMALEIEILEWLYDRSKVSAEGGSTFGGQSSRVQEYIETEKQNLLTVRRTHTGDLRFEGPEIASNVKDTIRYVDRFNLPQPGQMDKIRYVLIDEFRAERFKEVIESVSKKWNVEFVTEVPEGVNKKDIVVLVDPEDVDNYRGFNLYLPLIYCEKSFILSALLSINKPEKLVGTPVYEFVKGFYENLLGEEIKDEEIISWFTSPWLVKDKIQKFSDNLRLLRIAFGQIEISA